MYYSNICSIYSMGEENAENNAYADMNNFYASVECLYHPEILDMPVVVGGDSEARHGIVSYRISQELHRQESWHRH